MKTIFLLLIPVAVLFSGTNAMSVKGGMFKHPENPDMCTIGNMILKPGDVSRKPNGKCEIWTCYPKSHLSMQGCTKPGMREGCIEGEVLHPEAEFPQCCTREIKCQTHYYSDQKDFTRNR